MNRARVIVLLVCGVALASLLAVVALRSSDEDRIRKTLSRLTAAVMVQRPDLFGAVVCRVPVADMLRYHLFTVGRFWISEYGSADDPKQFPFLSQYSPLHTVTDGAVYPPVLITTADTDDRVSPGMAKKFAARLQASGHAAPVLIRVETKAGHGAGKPVSKVIEEDADIFSFVFKYLCVEQIGMDAALDQRAQHGGGQVDRVPAGGVRGRGREQLAALDDLGRRCEGPAPVEADLGVGSIRFVHRTLTSARTITVTPTNLAVPFW